MKDGFDQLQALHRRQFWSGIAASLFCTLAGFLAGLAYGLGYLADMAR